MRSGIGYDIHRLIPTVKPAHIALGGIEIPCYFRLEAHSDGDVLLHALTDACLGALALGDIGQWFPDSAAENRKRPSHEFLRAVVKKIHEMGWRVNQCDAVVLLEEPKLAPHIQAMRETIGRILEVELTCVSVKAKTSEGLGPIGERSAIAAQTVVTLYEAKVNDVSPSYK